VILWSPPAHNATACVAGRLAGVGRGALLEQAEAAFGADFLDDLHKRKRVLRRDYGLVELTFVRGTGPTGPASSSASRSTA
jgi:hypothetical protein